MSKDIRKVRKAINRRKQLKQYHQKGKKSVEEKSIVQPFLQEEEKHGYVPDFLESYSTSKEQGSEWLSRFLLKGILSVLLFLSVAFVWNTESSTVFKLKSWTTHAMTEEFPFAKMNRWYKETFGSPLSFTNGQEETQAAANTLALPINGSVAESFEDNGEGIMIAPEESVSVSALQEGIVIFAGNDRETNRTVVIQHPDGSKTTYGYLDSVDVHLYQFIENNQVVGQFTPTANDEMVYFSIEKDKEYVDPFQVIKVNEYK